MLVRRADERLEQRMRLERLGLEFRMELAADEIRMTGDFDDFDVRSVRRRAGDLQAAGNHRVFVLAVEFVAMAVALADFELAVYLVGEVRARSCKARRPGAWCRRVLPRRAVRAAYRSRGARSPDRTRWSPLPPIRNVAGILDAGGLRAETDPEIGNFLARVMDGVQHSYDAAFPESSGNQHAIVSL